MTARARRVLDDCRLALEMLEQESDLRRWRIHWAGALALLRAVGHVLEKVDGSDLGIRRAANTAHRRWKDAGPEHEIFREFIDRQRNNILKEYEFNTHPMEDVQFVVRKTLRPVDGAETVDDYQIVGIGDNVYRPLLDGFREGDDARDVYADAIEWWDRELTAIEKEHRTMSPATETAR